jgi:transcription antitermination factor NusG
MVPGPDGDGVSPQTVSSPAAPPEIGGPNLVSPEEWGTPGDEPAGSDPPPPLPPGEWSAAHVHSRAEKALARLFTTWGTPHFLPLALRQRSYGARRRESTVPLFPGYVFFDGGSVDRHQVLATNKVTRIIPSPEPERLRRELESIRQAILADATLSEFLFGEPGCPVVIRRGPMAGIEGILVQHKGRGRLVLEVRLIGRALLADVEVEDCEPG